MTDVLAFDDATSAEESAQVVATFAPRSFSLVPPDAAGTNLAGLRVLPSMTGGESHSWVRTNIRTTFAEAVEAWRADTAFTSSITEMLLHPAYLRVIGLGPAAVPLLIDILRVEPEPWFWALTAIVGEDIAIDCTGFVEAADAWVAWFDSYAGPWHP